jgi:hypothetical protein
LPWSETVANQFFVPDAEPSRVLRSFTQGDIMKRFLLLALVSSLAMLAVPGTAIAQPANDDFDDATIVTEPLPYTDSTSTVDATTAPDDPECAGNGHTVWYRFTPSTNMRLDANTFGSDYDTTLSVYTGSRGALAQIACNDDFDSLQSRVVFNATAGTTYFFMAGSFFESPGGNLVFTVQEAPPPLEIAVTVNPTGTFNPQTGVATISGTITCSQPASFAALFGELRQRAGRLLITGSFDAFLEECSGETSWMATVEGNGLFRGGSATASVFAFACTEFECVEVETMQTVRLRGSKS